MSARASAVAVLLLSLAVGGWFASTVRAGILWWGMDDFTAYVVLGRNLLHGLPYDRLDTVDDPGLPPSHLHESFPPFTPLLVALVEAAAAPSDARQGRTLAEEMRPHGVRVRVEQPPAPAGDADRPYGLPTMTMKRVLVAFFVAALLAAAWAFRRALPPWALPPFVLLLGAHPYLYSFKEYVRAEFPYLAFLMLWFCVVDVLDRRRAAGRPAGVGAVIACGALLYAGYATRSAAVVLVPTLLAWDVLRWRRIRVTSLAVLGVAALGYLAQKSALGSVEGGYVNQASSMFSPAILVENARQLFWKFQQLWDPHVLDGRLALPAAAGVLLLAALGLFARRRHLGPWDVYAAGYLAMILLLPTHSAWMRYLLPLLPVLLLDVVAGACWLAGWRPCAADPAALPRPGRLAMGAAPIALLLAGYVTSYAAMDHGPFDDGLTDPDTRAAYAYIVEHTDPDEIVVSAKNRTLTLVTGRPALPYPQQHAYGLLADDVVADHWERIGARLVLLKHTPPREAAPYGGLNHGDGQFLHGVETEDGFRPGYFAAHPHEFEERFRNDEFVIYAWRGR